MDLPGSAGLNVGSDQRSSERPPGKAGGRFVAADQVSRDDILPTFLHLRGGVGVVGGGDDGLVGVDDHRAEAAVTLRVSFVSRLVAYSGSGLAVVDVRHLSTTPMARPGTTTSALIGSLPPSRSMTAGLVEDELVALRRVGVLVEMGSTRRRPRTVE
ncbi:MAG: hypothetical protein U0793_30845 [Gemmataceae bacterium]